MQPKSRLWPLAHQSTYVIAEIGVNHDGEVSKAIELVEAAASSGANAVKIQTFSSELLARSDAPKPPYQRQGTPPDETQVQMLKRLELSREDHHSILRAAERFGVEFLSTPYDGLSMSFLVNELGVKRVKISSADLTNTPLLMAAARTGRSLILSTGMSTLEEVHQALACVYLARKGYESPDTSADITLPLSSDVQGDLASCVTLLQCTSQYPAPVEDANMQAIVSMRDTFGLPVGYSDHTTSFITAVMSVAYGSTMYERHLTMNPSDPGPDHAASLDPDGFAELVQLIRQAEVAMGSGVKEPAQSELGNRILMRRSLVAQRDISAGDIIRREDICLKRPGDGLGPSEYWNWLGKRAPCSFREGEPLRLN